MIWLYVIFIVSIIYLIFVAFSKYKNKGLYIIFLISIIIANYIIYPFPIIDVLSYLFNNLCDNNWWIILCFIKGIIIGILIWSVIGLGLYGIWLIYSILHRSNLKVLLGILFYILFLPFGLFILLLSFINLDGINTILANNIYLNQSNGFIFLVFFIPLTLFISFLLLILFIFRKNNRQYVYFFMFSIISSFIIYYFVSGGNLTIMIMLYLFFFLLYTILILFFNYELRDLFNFSYNIKLATFFVALFGAVVYLFVNQFKYLVVNNYYKIIGYNPFNTIYGNQYIYNTEQRIYNNNGVKSKDMSSPFLVCDMYVHNYKEGGYPALYYGDYKNDSNYYAGDNIYSNVNGGLDNYFKTSYSYFNFKKDKNDRISKSSIFTGVKVIPINKLPDNIEENYIFGSGILFKNKESNLTGKITFLRFFNGIITLSGGVKNISLEHKKYKFSFYEKDNIKKLYILYTGSSLNTLTGYIKIKFNDTPNSIYKWTKWGLENNKFNFKIEPGKILLETVILGKDLEPMLTGKLEDFIKKIVQKASYNKIDFDHDYTLKSLRIYNSDGNHVLELYHKNTYKLNGKFINDNFSGNVLLTGNLKSYFKKDKLFSFWNKYFTDYTILINLIGGNGSIKKVDCKVPTIEEYLDNDAYDFVLNDIKLKLAIFLLYLWILIFLLVSDITMIKTILEKNKN